MRQKIKRSIAAIFIISFAAASVAQQTGIINNTNSPHVKLKSINIGDCEWTQGFWADKFDVAEHTIVPHMGTLLKGDIGHAYNNLKIAAGLKEGEHIGSPWHDGDFFKWMEATVFVYAINKDKKLLDELDEIIAVIAKAQRKNGYLHTSNQLKGEEPFSNIGHHEMYNAGHLYNTACIHYRVTGKTNLLDIAVKNANLLYKVFQPKPDRLARFGYNQTQIAGLVELYRTTRDKRYLELAEIFLNMRGQRKNITTATTYKKSGDHIQDKIPFRKETEAVGHAVLALYLYSGAADIFAETGEQALEATLDRLWNDITNKKMYITGACGQTHHGSSPRVNFVHEAFISEYMMPNSTAYNETCANICNAMFNYRMNAIKGESKYADIMELVLYNSALSGISLDGKHYFYTNPLRRNEGQHLGKTDQSVRKPYINCFCCPPNLARTIAKASNWAYALSNNGIAVNLYGGNRLKTKMLDGSDIELQQETNYPWEGSIKLKIAKCKKEAFTIQLRIPGWATEANLKINGNSVDVDCDPGNYAKLQRKWKKGDVIALDIPMDIHLLEGHSRIEEIRNQVAIKRGPVVYCIESPDLPKGTQISEVYIKSNTKLKANYQADFLGGVEVINGNILLRNDGDDGMYRQVLKPTWQGYSARFIPYFAWSNRGKSEMTVFMPVVWEEMK